MTTRHGLIASILVGVLALAAPAAVQSSGDPETTNMVPELDVLHEIIMPLWHDAYPKKDVAALRAARPATTYRSRICCR